MVFDRRAVVVVALVMACGAQSDPWSGDVAMITSDANDARLHIVDSNSGDGVTIELATRTRTPVVWSPDGSSLAYVWHSDEGDPSGFYDALRRVDRDGDHFIGELEVGGTPQRTLGMSWSPRGNVLALSLDVYDPAGMIAGETLSVLFFLDASIEPRVRPVSYDDPSWAPDGTRVVGVYREDLGVDENYNPVVGDAELVIDDIDGAGEVLAVNTSAEEANPAWSPDGEWIAFSRWNGPPEGTFVVPVAGGAEQPVSGSECGDAQWFPDSRRLLLSCVEMLVEVDARTGTVLAEHPGPQGTLSPDGERVISADGSGHVEARDLDGSNRVHLGPGSYPIWRPSVEG